MDQPLWDPKFISQINKKKKKNLKVILNELSLNTMSNAIDKYIIIQFSIVNNPYHPYMFMNENYSSRFTIIFLGFCPEIPC